MSSPKTTTLAFCSIAAGPGIIFLIWSMSPGKRRHRNGSRIPPLQQCLAIASNKLSPVGSLCHSTTCLRRPMSVYKGCETRRDLTILAVNAQDETKLARKTEGRFRRADVETACARNNKKWWRPRRSQWANRRRGERISDWRRFAQCNCDRAHMPENFSSCLMSQLGNQDIFGSLLATLCMRDVLLRVQRQCMNSYKLLALQINFSNGLPCACSSSWRSCSLLLSRLVITA